jgi:hypothetical protein
MKPNQQEQKGSCCSCPSTDSSCDTLAQFVPLPMAQAHFDSDDAPCCGAKQGPPASPFERPGYTLCRFVDGFVETPSGPVPRLKNDLDWVDSAGTLRARLGISRDQYKVAPGLYCVGNPMEDSPVLVTANYKLSLDCLREDTAGLNAWILVLDTRGVNVWCAAAKKNFSTAEIVRQVKRVQLDKIVRHKVLIVPQLGAPGVAAHLVKKGCGFKVLWGPIASSCIKQYLQNGKKIENDMRRVTFSLAERVVLVPVEISLVFKPSLVIIFALFLLSGICPDIFSPVQALQRGGMGAAAYGMGLLAGAVLVPVFLPWLPFRSFYLKGILVGLAAGVMVPWVWFDNLGMGEKIALLLISCSMSSYAAMNFTGATPFTSPSGVEKEMRRGIPVQGAAVLAALILWVRGGFL